MTDRPTPFDLAFGPMAAERFPALEAGIAAAGRDPRDRDGFVLVREVVEWLRELHPEDGPGEGVGELVALGHASFLFWRDGQRLVAMDRDTLRTLLGPVPPPHRALAWSMAFYLQVPPQRVWGEVGTEAPTEPLDGCFVIPNPDRLDVVSIFGVQAGRPGFTVVQAAGPKSKTLTRQDRSPLFAPLLEGGAAAGLFQVTGPEELLELCHRATALLPAEGPGPGTTTVTLA